MLKRCLGALLAFALVLGAPGLPAYQAAAAVRASTPKLPAAAAAGTGRHQAGVGAYAPALGGFALPMPAAGLAPFGAPSAFPVAGPSKVQPALATPPAMAHPRAAAPLFSAPDSAKKAFAAAALEAAALDAYELAAPNAQFSEPESRERADFASGSRRGSLSEVAATPGGALGSALSPFSKGSAKPGPRAENAPVSRKTYATSSRGQALAGLISSAGAAASAVAALDQSGGAKIALFAWAGALAIAAVGYLGLSIRIYRAHRAAPSSETTKSAFSAPIAAVSRKDGDTRAVEYTAAFELLPGHVQKPLQVHEAMHLKGAGEFRAALNQANAHTRYILGELGAAAVWTANLPLRAWQALKRTGATVKLWWLGDAELKPITAPLDGKFMAVRGLLVLDAVLGATMGFLIGPMLAAAKTAGELGLATQWPTLALYSSLVVASFVAYMLVERKHVYMARGLTLASCAAYRVALQRSFVSQELDFHTENGGAGGLQGRLLNDTNFLSIKNVMVRNSQMIYLLYGIAGVGMMFYLSVPMAGLVLLSIPLIGMATGRFTTKIIEVGFATTNQKAELMKRGQESLSQAETVRMFASSEQELARYGKEVDALKELNEKEAKLNASYAVWAGALSEFFSRYAVYVVGAAAIALAWGLTAPQIAQFAIFAGFAKSGISGLFTNYMMFRDNHAKTETVRGMLKRAPKIQDPEKPKPANPRGTIAFENVVFGYPLRKDAGPVLNGLSFEVPAGKTVAFVGASGSGKSTVTRLFLRLWDPASGRVTIGGTDLRELRRKDLLDHVALVSQETYLFNTTIRENMLFGSEGAPEAELEAAIRKAGASFVFDKNRFPDGLKTQVAEGGGRLSGGERQRVAIVRALLRKPSILVLDEATSALDNRTEADVQAALETLQAGSDGQKPTTLVVAHRLSTVRNADLINVMDKGAIVESGTHEQLLAMGGAYAELWKKGGYEEIAKPQTSAEAPATAADVVSSAAVPAESDAASAGVVENAIPATKRSLRQRLAAFGATVGNLVSGDREVSPFVSKRKLALTSVLLVANAGLWIFASHGIGSLIDSAELFAKGGIGTASEWAMLQLAGLIVGAFALITWFEKQTAWLLGELRAGALADIRKAIMRGLHRRPMSFFTENDSASLATRINDDAEALAKKNVDMRAPLLKDVVMLVASTALVLMSSPIVAVAVLAMVPLLGLVNGYFGEKAEKGLTEWGKRRAALGLQGKETLSQIETVKSFAREDAAVSSYKGKADAVVDSGVENAWYLAMSHMFSSSLTDFFTKYLVYIVGAWAIGMAGGMTVGQIVALAFYAGFIKAAFDGISTRWMEYKSARGETEVVRGWLAEDRKTTTDKRGAQPLPEGRGSIVFEDVVFHYDEKRKGSGLNGVSLTIDPGKTVAFVGATGSGKSTLLKLLQRLWEPQSGRVLVDGMPVSDATQRSLASAIAKVPQSTILFDESLRYNMLYGRPDATEDELAAAITMARAEFVYDTSAFPKGLDTPVGEGGRQLSGGQRQRIAIVRALLKRPRVLLLDEATAALDPKTQSELQETLDGLTSLGSSAKPTTLVVAHNLTTVAKADQIVVLDQGRVVETGTHAELLALNGQYRKLWDRAQTEK